MHLNLSVQRNKPNLMLLGSDFRNSLNENHAVFCSVSNFSLKSLLSARDYYYSVKMDYPFNSLKCSLWVEILGSCHGLLCLYYSIGDNRWRRRTFLCLWNPATKEYKQIPKSPYDDDSIDELGMVAFEYAARSGDYKLLTRRGKIVQVYSLRLNSWRRIGDVEFRNIREAGVFVNGELHWLAVAPDTSQIVVSLDISRETFQEILLPKERLVNEQRFTTLGVLEGCLCVLVRGSDVRVEVWVMKDYALRDSWTRRYVIKDESIVNSSSLKLVWSFKSGEILFRIGYCGGLVLYDPEDESIRKRDTRRLDSHRSEASSYFESLVPLNSNTYEGRMARGIRRNMDEGRMARGIRRNMDNNRTRLPPRIPLAPRPPFRVCGGSKFPKEAPCKSSGIGTSRK